MVPFNREWCRFLISAAALTTFLVPAAKGQQAEVVNDLQRKAELCEREDQWSTAAEVYAELTRRLPDAIEWPLRLRRCQRQEAVSRRYSEGGTAVKLLRLPVDELIELYGEVLNKIQSHYAEEIELTSLLSHGVEQMDLALRNRTFQTAVLPAGVSEETIGRQRAAFRLRWTSLTASNPREAQRKVKALALGLRQDAGAKPAAVVLEFVYAACEALDPYSAYLPPDRFALEKTLAERSIAGVGIELGRSQEQFIIAAVTPSGPATIAGIQPNEQLVAIDGLSSRMLSLEEATLRLFGPTGSSVTLEVQSALDRQPRKVVLVRQRLAIPSVSEARLVESEAGVGYIHLAVFQSSTQDELDAAIAKLGDQGMRALILDLRGNPGGLFAAAVQVADRFISSGILVTARGRAPGASAVYRAQEQQVVTIPLVVLINTDTASGAEVVAGAVKDHHRGVIVGQKSAGKGSMQYIFPLHWRGDAIAAESGLRLTTAHLFSPLDNAFTGHGVLPDVTVDRVPDMADPGSMMSMLQLQQLQFDAALQAARELASKTGMQ